MICVIGDLRIIVFKLCVFSVVEKFVFCVVGWVRMIMGFVVGIVFIIVCVGLECYLFILNGVMVDYDGYFYFFWY